MVTDHFSLKWLFKDHFVRIARWAGRLQQYDFDIVHRNGKNHILPNTLSRAVPIIESVKTIENLLSEDKWYKRMKQNVQQQPSEYSLWRADDGKLNTRGHIKRKDIIKSYHDPKTCGYLSIYNTHDRIATWYYW